MDLGEGEKLFEELLIDYQAEKTSKNFIFKSNETKINIKEFIDLYDQVITAFDKNDAKSLKEILGNSFINYQPNYKN